jgi:hypothetical protein
MTHEPTVGEVDELHVLENASLDAGVRFPPRSTAIFADEQDRLERIGLRVQVAGENDDVVDAFDVGDFEKGRARFFFGAGEA